MDSLRQHFVSTELLTSVLSRRHEDCLLSFTVEESVRAGQYLLCVPKACFQKTTYCLAVSFEDRVRTLVDTAAHRKSVLRSVMLTDTIWRKMWQNVGDFAFAALLALGSLFKLIEQYRGRVGRCHVMQLTGPELQLADPLRSNDCSRTDNLKSADIEWRRVLHVSMLAEKFSAAHILSRAIKSTETPAAETLLRGVFDIGGDDAVLSSKLRPLLTDLLRRFRRCRFAWLLRRYCPLCGVSGVEPPQDCDSGELLHKLVDCFTPPGRVAQFLRVVIARILTTNLLGTKNRLLVLQWPFVLTQLRRFDRMPLRHLMNGLKVRCIPWLKGVRDSRLQEHLATALCAWIVRLLQCLVKSFFYVTESQKSKHRLLYYRKLLWCRMMRLAEARLIVKCSMQSIKSVVLKNWQKEDATFGPFSVRFVPKSGGMRPIIRSVGRQTQLADMNRALLPLLAVFQLISLDNAVSYGFGLKSDQQIFAKYNQFHKKKWKQHQGAIANYYTVKVDIDACFDRIRQDLLIKIIAELLQPYQNFVVQEFSHITHTSGGKWRWRTRCAAWPMRTYGRNFAAFLHSDLCNLSGSGFIAPRGEPFLLTAQDVVQQLKLLVTHHVLKLDKQFYLQTSGIPQGCSVSTMLCNFYYGHFEKHCLSVRGDEILLRYVDDYLYRTPDQRRAYEFLLMLLQGVDVYQCQARAEKCVVNFSHPDFAQWPNLKVMSTDSVQLLTWCGYCFDLQTWNVYSKEDNWSTIRDNLVLDFSKTPVHFVEQKLAKHFLAKLPRLCTDLHVNQPEGVLDNLVRSASFCIAALDCFLSLLPVSERERNPHKLKVTMYNVLQTQVKHIIPHSSLKSDMLWSFRDWLCWSLHSHSQRR